MWPFCNIVDLPLHFKSRQARKSTDTQFGHFLWQIHTLFFKFNIREDAFIFKDYTPEETWLLLLAKQKQRFEPMVANETLQNCQNVLT